jgi:hypothetical protein
LKRWRLKCWGGIVYIATSSINSHLIRVLGVVAGEKSPAGLLTEPGNPFGILLQICRAYGVGNLRGFDLGDRAVTSIEAFRKARRAEIFVKNRNPQKRKAPSGAI